MERSGVTTKRNARRKNKEGWGRMSRVSVDVELILLLYRASGEKYLGAEQNDKPIGHATHGQEEKCKSSRSSFPLHTCS